MLFLSKRPNISKSAADLRTQVAAFILSHPTFIAGIHPAISILNQTRSPLRWKQLMLEGGAKKETFEDENASDLQDANEKVTKELSKYLKDLNHTEIPTKPKAAITAILNANWEEFEKLIKNKTIELNDPQDEQRILENF